MLSPKIFTNLHIIMYILIFDFQSVVGWGGGGGGKNVYLHIGQIVQGSLSLTRAVVGGKKIAFVLVIVPVMFSSRYSTITCF